MPLPLMLVSLLGAAAGLGIPGIPDMPAMPDLIVPAVPDLIEIAENSVQGNFSAQTVEEPKVWLPTIAEIKAMTDEERTERFLWFLFVFVLLFFSAVFAGTIVMVVGAEAKVCCNSYHAVGQTAPLSKKAQILLVMLSFLVTVSLSFAAAIWSLQTGRLSKKLGLDWEVYLFLFSCGCLSLLIQSVVVVAWIKARDRFDATAFAVASMSVLPFLSDQFDTLKDIIFGALCVQSEHWAIKVLGVLSWLYLLAFHAWFVFCAAMKETREFHDRFGLNPLGANCFSELATSHVAVLLTAPKVDGESSAGFWEGTILPTLYKQLTPSKREYLLIENLPQAVLSLLFLFFEGGSVFFVVLNLAVPAMQIGLTFLLFQPARAGCSCFGQGPNRAVHNGNWIAAKTIWLEAEVGEDIVLFQRMLPRLRFLLDFMERSGFKELDKLSEGELQAWRGIAGMLARGEAKCSLRYQKIGNSGAKVVVEAMKHTAMEVLLLGNNEIGAEGAEALGESLKGNNSLQRLELYSNNIGDAVAKALGEGLKENNSLEELYLNNNSIDDAGAEALGEGLKENNSLQTLWLSHNSIGDAGAKALGEGLKENRSLKWLSLSGNSIGDVGAQALAAEIIENRSLQCLRVDKSLHNTPGGKALIEAEKVKRERGERFGIEW